MEEISAFVDEWTRLKEGAYLGRTFPLLYLGTVHSPSSIMALYTGKEQAT
jgi:hypothetical protein